MPSASSSSSISTPDLSVAVIARDNERTIDRTLASVQGLAGRLIVVDSGSRDRTIEIARSRGAEVIHHDWEGHIGQKQFALQLCTTRWVLSLDSDESLDGNLAAAVRRAVESDNSDIAGYALNRRAWLGDSELRHAFQPEWRTRLVRPDRAVWVGYDPHDRLDVRGTIARLNDGLIRHDAFADVPDLIRKQVAHGLRAADSYYALGRRGSPLSLCLSPPAAILKQLALRTAFLDGWPGWVAAFGAGLNAAVKHMALLELSNNQPPHAS